MNRRGTSKQHPVIQGGSAGMVANFFLILSFLNREPVSPLKLIKLTYMTYGCWLAVKGERLFDEPIEVWNYGPVIPSLYHEFKHYGQRPIMELSNQVELSDEEDGDSFPYEKERGICIPVSKPDVGEEKSAELEKAIRWAWKTYAPYTAVELSRMTHAEGSPWDKARKSKRKYISDQDIQDHFCEILGQGRCIP